LPIKDSILDLLFESVFQTLSLSHSRKRLHEVLLLPQSLQLAPEPRPLDKPDELPPTEYDHDYGVHKQDQSSHHNQGPASVVLQLIIRHEVSVDEQMIEDPNDAAFIEQLQVVVELVLVGRDVADVEEIEQALEDE
jgi:hypothetical protein